MFSVFHNCGSLQSSEGSPNVNASESDEEERKGERERSGGGVRGGGGEEVTGNSVEGGFPHFRVQATPGVWRDDPAFWGLGGGGGGRGQDTKGEP